jgi:hypothetical protein
MDVRGQREDLSFCILGSFFLVRGLHRRSTCWGVRDREHGGIDDGVGSRERGGETGWLMTLWSD